MDGEGNGYSARSLQKGILPDPSPKKEQFLCEVHTRQAVVTPLPIAPSALRD